MIPRYSRPEMAAIWAPENRFRIWFEIEAHALDAQAMLGVVPKSAARKVWRRGKWRISRIDAIERKTKHDVIAFLTNLAAHVGPEARFIHQGMTSSDVLDTCLAVQLAQAADILLADVDRVLAALRKRALEHKRTPCVGRSHGIHAEPTTFGLKLAGFYAEFARARARLVAARREIATCAISGAVGTFANVDPFVERHVARKLGLAIEPASTQVIPRDRHAMFFATLGVVASSIERLATEIRHLQRSEVREVEEYFSSGQKGSSAMPHKRNPVLSENLTGLARVVRASVIPALENVALWHERDISHSSVERVFAPDATIALDFALTRLAGLIDRLIVYPDRMRANLDAQGGLMHSQRVLLALTQAGLSREGAYKIVQRNAMRSWSKGENFLALLAADKDVTAVLARAKLAKLFDLGYHLKHVDTIFRRVFGATKKRARRR
ncbi:MAG TPA: adenylosuccinate lyase [Alphaproteobacteria bacterium]|nr:adenylosuccinate lyase [Alphaproteobacteria bacterium]